MPSDLVLQIALYACLITAGLTLILLVLIACFRWRFERDGQRYRNFEQAWQPRLVKVIMGEALAHSERLTRPGQVVLLRLWNYWSESMAGDSRLRLKQHVQALGCDALAMRLVRRGNRAQKLLSVISLGNLQHTPAWPDLLALIDKEDQILALHAARALLQIDAEQAMRELLPKILVREHWELSVISNIIKGARGAFENALLAQWPALGEPARTRAFKLCDHLNMPLPEALLVSALQAQQAHAQLLAALQLVAHLQTPHYRAQVVALLDHFDGRVRAQAVLTLGATATAPDTALLLEMLTDKDLLVRHSAAQSLLRLPSYGAERLARFNQALCNARVHQAVTMALLDQGVPG